MNSAISKHGKAGLVAMMSYEVGKSVAENEEKSAEKIITKEITRTEVSNDNKDLIYIIIALLVAIIIITALRMLLKKKPSVENIQLRQL